MSRFKIKWIYVLLLTVFVASFVTYKLLPYSSFLKELSAIPLIGSLVGGLQQILKDMLASERLALQAEVAHERQMYLQNSQQGFTIGATSHMANRAFDKHASFAEEYMQEVFNALNTLFAEGPTQVVMPHAVALSMARRKYAVWLTPQLEASLLKFEQALVKISTHATYVETTRLATDKQKWINEMYDTFASVLGKESMGDTWQGKALDTNIAIASVAQGLRKVLGTEELTEIRSAFIQKALDTIKASPLQPQQEI